MKSHNVKILTVAAVVLLTFAAALVTASIKKSTETAPVIERDISSAGVIPTIAPTPIPTPTPVVTEKLEGEHSWDEIYNLEQENPYTRYDYDFQLYGRSFNLLDENLDLNHVDIEDEGELVKQVTACMPNLKYLDMDFCGVSNESMAEIRDELPDVKVVWRIWFGTGYSCRTDVEKILASCPGAGGNLYASNTGALKYCTDVKYLDIGHNQEIGDISFLAYMPELEVLIIAMDDIDDEMLKVLEKCPRLEFLEIQTNHITNLSPLQNMHNLKHLNIGHNFNLSDISPLYGLTQLERLWIGVTTQVPEEQMDKMEQLCKEAGNDNFTLNRTTYDPHGGWRWGSERYELLTKQLGYDTLDYQTIWNDPKYLGENHPYY